MKSLVHTSQMPPLSVLMTISHVFFPLAELHFLSSSLIQDFVRELERAQERLYRVVSLVSLSLKRFSLRSFLHLVKETLNDGRKNNEIGFDECKIYDVLAKLGRIQCLRNKRASVQMVLVLSKTS